MIYRQACMYNSVTLPRGAHALGGALVCGSCMWVYLSHDNQSTNHYLSLSLLLYGGGNVPYSSNTPPRLIPILTWSLTSPSTIWTIENGCCRPCSRT